MRRGALLAGVAALALAPMPAAVAAPGPANAPEYWFDDWHVQSLWDSGARGQGITIAEIDTGVNAELPELRGRVLSGIDYGRSGNGQIDREIDGFGHGTAMASIMVARPGLLGITGLAPGAKILPIAVALSGTTDAERPDKLPDAIRWAVDHKAKIINMSLGGKRSAEHDGVPCSTDEQDAVYYAMRKGALVIASVGNTGPTANTVEDPGVCLGVISVGAVDSAGKVAEFSGRQPYLTLVAPGVGIASLGRQPGTAYSGDGTSQATALTSATAALVWSAHPELDATEVAARILATLDGRRTTPSPSLGYGELNAYRAVTGGAPRVQSAAAAASSRANPVYAAAAPFATRAEALRRVLAHPPTPAAKQLASTGSFDVATHPRVTPEVITGLAMAGAGAMLLLVLLGFGLRGQGHRRRPAAAGPPVPTLPEQAAAAPHPAWTTPPVPVALQAAARPRPRPGPGRIPPTAGRPTVGPVAAQRAASSAARRPRPGPGPRAQPGTTFHS
ncbi:MAG: S8 family serine peptidase [Jatrophihabitans sp.]|uniref:S8 family peptidase n=1 Tax=Jatrophihabitans sp. TaxID=1932789 RepID=UPI003910BAF8